MGKKAKKLIGSSMSVLVVASSMNLNALSVVHATDTLTKNASKIISPVMISEIVADTHQSDMTTASGKDAFEYIELYNTTNQTLNMDNYLIQNVNGSTHTLWEIPEGTTIEAGETLVVWVRNSESDSLDENKFRSYYNITDESVNIVKTNESVKGFSNSGERSMEILVKDTKQVINSMTYNDGEAKAQTKKGITFQYQNGRIQELTLGYDGDPTPGSLVDEQTLDDHYVVNKDEDAAVSLLVNETFNPNASYVVKATTNLTSVILEAKAFINNKSYNMTYDNGEFFVSIPASDLSGLESFELSVELTDGVNELKSNKTINAETTDSVKYQSPLLLTEFVPNTVNVDGSDAFEYFEVYNASNQTVDLKDYHFIYDNGSKETEWILEDDIQLDAKKTLTVWIQNEKVISAHYTVNDFNKNYGTALEKGKDLTTVQSDGLSNSGSRTMKITSQTGLELNRVEYNAQDSSNEKIDENESIYVTYESSEGVVHYDGEQTVGNVSNQIFGEYQRPDVIENPTVSIDAPSVVSNLQDYEMTIQTNLEKVFTATADIYSGETLIDTINFTYDNDILKGSIAYNAVKNYDSITYKVTISDGVNQATYTSSLIPVQSGEVDVTNAPALTITEVIPDTSNVDGADAYEFIEIYNNSNKDINLKDYKLYYNYPDSGSDSIWWETNEDKILKSGETLVFWIKNGTNDALPKDNFNEKWGTNLSDDQLIEISCGGMSNSGARGIKIATNVKDVIDYVTYNMDGTDNTTADKSIVYQNQYNNGQFQSVLVSDGRTPTPGRVDSNTKPQYSPVLPDTVSEPVLEDRTASTFHTDEDFAFEIKASSQETTIKTVSLYMKDNKSNGYTQYNLLRNNGDVFNYTLASVDLIGKSSYEYYFVVSDGYQTVTTDVKTVNNEEGTLEGDRFNIDDQTVVSQNQQIIGTGENLILDGKDITGEAKKSISNSAKIAFDASQTDVFFKNAVSIGNDSIGVFNEGTYDSWMTYSYDVDAKYFDYDKKQVTIAFHAGNKANVLEHNIENNDDFVLKNIRLVLPDGTSLRGKYTGVKGLGAVEHTADNWHPDQPETLDNYSPQTEISMGDGTSKIEILYVTFDIPEASFDSLRYDLDTTKLSDGVHTLQTGESSIQFIVDNTAPEIMTNMEEDAQYRSHTIEASAKDAISKNVSLLATLDNQAIELPYAFDTKTLDAGEHVLSLTATDEVGNMATKTITFTVPEENATVGEITPGDGSVIHGDPTLSVQVSDATNDVMNVAFKKGQKYTLNDQNIQASQGVSQTSGTNEQSFETNSANGFPYQQFDIKVDSSFTNKDAMKVHWEGESNNAKTFMYVYNHTTQEWDLQDAQKIYDGSQIELTASIELNDYLKDSSVRVMIQNGEGYTPPQYDSQTTRITISNEDDTPREDYDFTFVVESDTQYYNEDYDGNPEQDVDGSYQYQLDIHEWVLANRERMNIQYMFHDGDIIDDEHLDPEWENADKAYKILDEAGMPYGVLAGNHDVGHLSGDYTSFSQYFGEERYNQNPWYGQSYKDNRGHYDLISVGGIDFIMIYMGWGIGDEEIQWMNDVLAQYPERKAILNFHEYLLASGGLGEEPQRIHDEVVAVNPNVCMVLSGHYHNAQTNVESFDDNHDGVADRTVYQMLFDYQGLKAGGMGYIRLMHFDLEGEKIIIRTYSPSLDDYDAKDETDIGDVANINGEEEFEIPFSALGIEPKTKSLETSSLDIDVYGSEVLGEVKNVESGQTAQLTLNNLANQTLGWYAEITDENGGLTRTDVQYITVNKEEKAPTIILPSDNTFTVGEEFDPMKGVSATDYTGKDITSQIQVAGQVNTSKPGTYELTYTVYDEYGYSTQARRVITVKAESSSQGQPSLPDENRPMQNPNQNTPQQSDNPSQQIQSQNNIQQVQSSMQPQTSDLYGNFAGYLFVAIITLIGIVYLTLKNKIKDLFQK